MLLPYDRIVSRPTRAENAYCEASLEELCDSIRINGLLQPICVCALDGSIYQIIAGERRFRAAVMAGLRDIPCIVLGCEDETGVLYALIEGQQQRGLHYLEEAELLRQLRERGYSVTDLSQTLSKPIGYLMKKLGLLRLSEGIRDRLRDNVLSEDYAAALLEATEETRDETLDRILAEDLSLTETRELIRQRRERGRRGNIMVFKDLKVFCNTVERAVDTMRRSGISSDFDKTETEDYIAYTVKISKTG